MKSKYINHYEQTYGNTTRVLVVFGGFLWSSASCCGSRHVCLVIGGFLRPSASSCGHRQAVFIALLLSTRTRNRALRQDNDHTNTQGGDHTNTQIVTTPTPTRILHKRNNIRANCKFIVFGGFLLLSAGSCGHRRLWSSRHPTSPHTYNI